MSFVDQGKLKQIGIPLKVEKLVGKTENKLYFGLSIIPIFIFGDIEEHSLNNAWINVWNKSELLDLGASLVQTRDAEITYKEQNVLNQRLDYRLEIGILHKKKKNMFKIGAFYEESITTYTKIKGERYGTQMAGLKLGIQRTVYKGGRA